MNGTTTAVAGILAKCYRFTDAAEARAAGWYPYFRPIEQASGATVTIEGRELIMAGSNNYLGLATDPRVTERAARAIRDYGSSCSGSRFMNGTLRLHHQLEERLAAFVGKPAALSFPTGYQTNLGAISALLGRGDHILSDKYNHASIMDGIFLSMGLTRQVEMHRYRHNDMTDLGRLLDRLPGGGMPLIVTDGVFSMEGDIVDLPRLRRLADRHDAAVYLDEAHALGVLGATGRGTTEHHGTPDLADIIMCTFSKSLGSIGGFIAAEPEVIDFIQHHARPLIFSASVPPGNLGAVLAALEIIESEPERVRRLQQIGRTMVTGFRELGFDIGTAETPIVPLVIGDDDLTFRFWQRLYERGVYVNPVVSPAVPPNRALIRTSFMAVHTDRQLDRVLEIAGEEGRRLGIIA